LKATPAAAWWKRLGAKRQRALLLGAAAGLYAASLAAVSWATLAGPERWTWSTLNLYLPQWPWAVPAAALLVFAVRQHRRSAVLPLLALGWVVVVLMGLCWPRPRPGGAGTRVRVMTFNVGGSRDVAAVLREINRYDPDLLFLQESTAVPGLHPAVAATRQLVGFGCAVASKTPLTDLEIRPLREAPEWRNYVRCKTVIGGRTVTLCGVHLDTPREGLDALRRAGPFGLGAFDAYTAVRVRRGLGLGIDMRHETPPLLLAGDFNAPERSLLFQPFRALRLQNAFSTGGWGYGYTYGHRLPLRHSVERIDHVWAGPEWRVERCWSGSGSVSDHRPLIADLVLAAP
jgi:endonuclease/exonuclease/phosphatase (EEP) superfamily protein YafD